MTTFDFAKTALGKLLEEVVEGEIQLPDFQPGWVTYLIPRRKTRTMDWAVSGEQFGAA